jgi:hypothetical protein
MDKYEDLVTEEDKRAFKDKARNAQIKADAEAMRKKYPEKAKKAEKPVMVEKKQVGNFVVDDSEPTEKELKMLQQMKKERDMDRNTERGATRPRRLDYVEPFKKGGMVTKGNGCAVRGVKKFKTY